MTTVSLTGYGRYVPDGVITGPEIAERSGVPEDVVVDKMGVREKHVCPPDDDHCSDMALAAGGRAPPPPDAGLAPTDVDLLLYHGSEYKDYVVWSLATDVAERIGAENAVAMESHSLCASAPIAIRQARAQLLVDDFDTALLVTASREEDLVDYENQRSSFMFNFGSGASAMVLETDAGEDAVATVHESAAITDGNFSRDVIMHAGGSLEPPSEETLADDRHRLDVPDPDGMKERLGPVSLPNYLDVADDALEQSGFGRDDLDYVAITHMKRSFHETVFAELGLDPDADGYYLDDYGHVQSADQIIALQEGVDRGLVADGDLVGFLAAGTGYTWSATMLTWQGE